MNLCGGLTLTSWERGHPGRLRAGSPHSWPPWRGQARRRGAGGAPNNVIRIIILYCQGLTISTPVGVKSATFRVTTVSP